jgi:hypothetical protein
MHLMYKKYKYVNVNVSMKQEYDLMTYLQF